MGMTYSEALEALKSGAKVAREGWNGKGMFIFMVQGIIVPTADSKHLSPEWLEAQGLTELEILPHIDMWAADKKQVVGWLASQTDMLASDWTVSRLEGE